MRDNDYLKRTITHFIYLFEIMSILKNIYEVCNDEYVKRFFLFGVLE